MESYFHFKVFLVSMFHTTFPDTAARVPSKSGKSSSKACSRTWLVFFKKPDSFFPISSSAVHSNSLQACSFALKIWKMKIKNTFTGYSLVSVQFDQFYSAVTAHIKWMHSTSLVSCATVRTALFGLRTDGDPGRQKFPEVSWLNRLSSVSDIVDGCGRVSTEMWEQGCKPEIG